MQVKRQFSRDYIFLCALTLAVLCILITARRNAGAAEEEKFDRAQNVIVNLNKMQGSAGWWLLQDIRKMQTMDHDLGKARFQIEEADKLYAKLRGRPDDRYLGTVQL